MPSKLLIAFGAMAIFACAPLSGLSQPQEVLEDGSYLLTRRPSTSIADLRKALEVPFKTKEFQDPKEFAHFVKQFQTAISKKGKEIEIVIDDEAFMSDDPKVLRIADEKITMPPVPTKIVAETTLRLALTQVGRGEAAYWLRSGQIVITSHARVRSAHFIKSTEVAGDFKNRPLVDALDALAEQSGVSIIVDRRVMKKAQTSVTAKFVGNLETAVRLFTDGAGLKHVVVENAIYVTSPANAIGFKEKTAVQIGGGSVPVDVKNRPLLTALGYCWIVDPRVKHKTNIRVTAKWINHVEGDTALRILTDMAGLCHVVVDGIVYITDAANAKKMADEQDRKKPEK